MNIGDLARHTLRSGDGRPRLCIVIENEKATPIENMTCMDGPIGPTRTRVAWVDGSGVQWVSNHELREEKIK